MSIFRSAVFLTFGNALTAFFQLLRNILVASLISVHDFGIAATFVIVMALIEMMSQLGLDRMIIQDKDGDQPQVQSSIQFFQFLRGIVGMVLLLLIAAPYAQFMHAEEATWAYLAIAVVPLMSGLLHFDIFRAQRQMIYRPIVLTELIPAALSLAVVYPLYMAFGDWRVMLWAILMQNVLVLLLSHLLAERRYRFSFNPGLLKRVFVFGLPLLANGLLLFFVFNGEKLIVGRELGLEKLAVFAMAVSLTLSPTLVLAKSSQAIFLPQLSAVQADDAAFNAIAYRTLQTSLLIGLLLLAGLIVVGPPIVAFALGVKYETILGFLVWLGIAQALRVGKTGLAVISISRAKTGNAMAANLPRVFAIPIAWLLVRNGGGITEIIVVAIIAECVGFAVALWRVNKQVRLPLRPVILPISLTALGFVLVGLRVAIVPLEPGLWFGIGWYDVGWIAVILAVLIQYVSRPGRPVMSAG